MILTTYLSVTEMILPLEEVSSPEQLCGRQTSSAAPARRGKRFFATLDGIRGVAATAVVAGHTQALFGRAMGAEIFLAVDIFFILSGVVIANAYEQRLRSGLTAMKFAKLRFIRLYPLYILGTGFGLLAMMLGFWWYKTAGPLPFALILAIPILPNPFAEAIFPLNPPAWSLFFELFVNIIYAFALPILTSRILAVIMIVSALAMAGIVYFVGPDPGFNIGWSPQNFYGGFFRVGYSFFAGVALYRLFASRPSAARHDRRGAILAWLILGVVAMLLAGAHLPSAFRPYYEFTTVVFVFPAVVYSALWVEPIGFGAQLCKFLGAISYAIYAIHEPLYWLFGLAILNATGVPAESWTPWAGFCFLGALLPFCWAVDKYYDGPLRRFLLARS